MDAVDSLLISRIRKYGEEFPKKHGSWFRAHCFDDYYLLHDTWNGYVYLHKGCESSGTDNMYRVVYMFSGYQETLNIGPMRRFWLAHIDMSNYGKDS